LEGFNSGVIGLIHDYIKNEYSISKSRYNEKVVKLNFYRCLLLVTKLYAPCAGRFRSLLYPVPI